MSGMLHAAFRYLHASDAPANCTRACGRDGSSCRSVSKQQPQQQAWPHDMPCIDCEIDSSEERSDPTVA
eukprot:4487100-Amphidinium_carterae.1